LEIFNEKGNSEIVEYFPNIIILASKKNFKIKGLENIIPYLPIEVDESCMFSCGNSDLKLLLQVVDERRICIVISVAGSSVECSVVAESAAVAKFDEFVEYG
jgi:hypothetical protein